MMKTKITALMAMLIYALAAHAQYYSCRIGESISLPKPSTPAGYNGILNMTYSSDSKYLSVYSGTSTVKVLSYFSGTETVRCDLTCYREVYSSGRLYYYYGTSSAYYFIKCSSPAPGLVLAASPGGGQVGIGSTVKLSVTYNGSDISGCDIYYTLNGSTPTKNSTPYRSGITIDGDCTLKAIAYKNGYTMSDILTEKYTVVDITLSADPAGGNVTKGTVVHLYSNKPNASIRYTLNGSTPSMGDPLYKSEEGIVINQSCTLKATAKINGSNYSIISTPVMEWKFSVSSRKLVLTATPSGGQINKGSVVKLTTKADGTTINDAQIYYTLDGSTPGIHCKMYSSSGISITSDCTLKAVAYRNGYETSNILTANYTTLSRVIKMSDSEGLADIPAEANVEYERHFYKGWNSLCVPFALTKEMLDRQGEGIKIAIYKRVETVGQQKQLVLQCVDKIKAGQPCLVFTSKEFNCSFKLENESLVNKPDNSGLLKGSFTTVTIGAGYYKLASDGASISITTDKEAKSMPFRAYLDL